MRCVDTDFVRLVEESVAQIPQPDSRVGKILVFDLTQTHAAVTVDVSAEPGARYQLEAEVDVRLKSVFLRDILQYREEYDDQFLVEIHLPFLVYGIQVGGTAVLDYRSGVCDGLAPVLRNIKLAVFAYYRLMFLGIEGQEEGDGEA